jgi:GT2 family glycosyltransferase
MPSKNNQTVAQNLRGGAEEIVDLSVIVLTHNSRDLLARCLSSIREETHTARLEVIVVDNDSNDGTAEMAAADFPEVRLITCRDAFRFTVFNNRGLRESRGRYVLLLNDDTELKNDALDQVVRYFDEHPDCGALGCKLLNSDLSIQYSCRRFPSFTTAFFSRYSILTRAIPGNRFSTNYLMTDFDHDSTIEVDWVSGACLAARRSVMDKVGMLDERIIYFNEDVDWCLRIRQAGWKVVYLHSAEVIHWIGATRRRRPFRSNWIRHRSMFYFYRKHYSKGILFMDAAVGLGIFARACLETAGEWAKGGKR